MSIPDIHPVADIELNSLFIVSEHRNNLKALPQNTRSSARNSLKGKGDSRGFFEANFEKLTLEVFILPSELSSV